MPRSIRARITLMATTITLGVCVLVCIALYVGLHIALHREVDGFLQGEVHEFRAILEHEEDDDLQEIEGELRAELGSRRETDLTFRLLDPNGKLLITSDPNDQFTNPWPFSTQEMHKSSSVYFDTLSSGSASLSFRFCWEHATLFGRGDVIIQAVYRLDRVERSLAICRWVCLIALALATGLSLVGGRAVARNSLRPVVAITESARNINAQRLSDRVPRTGANDELDDLAQTLNDMLTRVEASFRQIQQFTADAAHELRTPLTALRGAGELVLAQPRTEEQLRSVIEQSLEYYRVLGRVTDDLLLLARLDAGQEPLCIDRFNIAKAIEDVVDLYRPLANDRGIEVHFDKRDEISIHADSAKIRRVFSNLLDNSIKYMPGKGDVTVTLETQAAAVAVTVRDTGPGIAPDDLPRVFERFYRTDRARKATGDINSRSAGLGLAISRSIIEAHGGDISIESTVGLGTKVLILLPLRNNLNL